jgi:demethylmenaquinone methyltransferase/2-methoxy-6-polyprenyl-1,4-benzoquinol methylase
MTASPRGPEKSSGTTPPGARDEREAARYVRDMFSRIAPRYDFLNHLLSFSLDRLWRRQAARRFVHILVRSDARILDLCCGTGDLAFAIERERAPDPCGIPIIGCDFAPPMLERAQSKSSGRAVVFVGADALKLPFAGASFDLVASAFGFRNLANYEAGLQEIARVLKPGGEVGILEFASPSSGPLAAIFRLYFRWILPSIGGAISGNWRAYSYLPNSVSKFPTPKELAVIMERNGFADVRVTSRNFGSVVLHSARRA